MEPTSQTVHEDEVEWEETSHGSRFGFRRKGLAAATGGKMIGCSLYELEPGKRSWPLHYHFANEEAVYVLDGRGTLRLGDREAPLRRGDYVTFPVGRGGTHQVVNDSDATLRYLCISTMVEPEIGFYPESGKLGLFAGSAPGGRNREDYTLVKFLPDDAAVDYWDGEE